jgi:hypothetical protein
VDVPNPAPKLFEVEKKCASVCVKLPLPRLARAEKPHSQRASFYDPDGVELVSLQFSDQASHEPDVEAGGPEKLPGMVVRIEKELREERVLHDSGHIE